jgi:hypothetical protein
VMSGWSREAECLGHLITNRGEVTGSNVPISTGLFSGVAVERCTGSESDLNRDPDKDTEFCRDSNGRQKRRVWCDIGLFHGSDECRVDMRFILVCLAIVDLVAGALPVSRGAAGSRHPSGNHLGVGV